jgi:uncharacterized membrane protein YphA (DoxX/SURF4 family)
VARIGRRRSNEDRTTVPVALAGGLRPVYQAFMLLRTGFTVLPILFGADKFFNAMVNWEQYLAPAIPKAIGLTPELFMRGVGVIEIVAGLLVAIIPRYAAYIVMAWLWLIIANLVMTGQYWDIALRDFGLSVGALVLGRLALAVHRH